MDETPEYILMCQKATEIQEQWNLENDTNYIAEILDNYAMTEVYMGHFLNNSIKILKANNQGDNYVWLPKQDQLQEKVKDFIFGSGDNPQSSLIFAITDWYTENRIYASKLKSMEQIWLAAYMFWIHNKVWDGKDWVRL